MSGGGAGPIILKLVKQSLSVAVTPSGKWKLYHVLIITHALAWAVGKWF